MGLLDRLLGRSPRIVSAVAVPAPELHRHEWVPIRRGFPQRMCRCGCIWAPGGMKAGHNTISVSPAAYPEIIRFTADGTPIQRGDSAHNLGSGLLQGFHHGVVGYASRWDALGGRRGWAIQQNPNAITRALVGTATDVTQNSPGVGAVVTDEVNFQCITCQSAAAANSDAGWIITAFTVLKSTFYPCIDFEFKGPLSETAQRMWVGVFSASPMAFSTPGASGAIHGAGFRYDTGVDGTTFWRFVTSNGVGDTVTVTTLPVGASYRYFLRIAFDYNVPTFFGAYLAPGGSVSHKLYYLGLGTATMPAVTTGMGPVMQVRALAAAARTLGASRIACCQNLAPM